jgi:hypothetical protein
MVSGYGRILIVVCTLSLCAFMAGYACLAWIHKLSFGTFFGRVNRTIASPVVFQDEEGNNITLDSLGGNISCRISGILIAADVSKSSPMCRSFTTAIMTVLRSIPSTAG